MPATRAVGGWSALVVSQAAARTTVSVLLGAVVAGLAAGLAPPAAAIVGGVPLATAVLLAIATRSARVRRRDPCASVTSARVMYQKD